MDINYRGTLSDIVYNVTIHGSLNPTSVFLKRMRMLRVDDKFFYILCYFAQNSFTQQLKLNTAARKEKC